MEQSAIKLNVVFIIQLVTVFVAAIGMVPREALLFSGAVLVFFVLFSPVRESVLLIARSIPILTALPLTEHFDSLNIWRILVLIMFLQWVWQERIIAYCCAAYEKLKAQTRMNGMIATIRYVYGTWRIEFLMLCLFLVAFFSLLQVENFAIGAKRIIYFANLGMLFFVVRSVVQTIDDARMIARNVVIGALIVLAVGVVQLGMAYIVHIDYFAEFWALEVNQALYGSGWAYIAVNANTWFAYYNDTIHLRMFSSFPDTHSFPLYLLMSMCFAMLLFWKNRWVAIVLALATAALVLSGTRGIWLAALFPALLLAYLAYMHGVPRQLVRRSVLPLVLFAVALPLSTFIFSSTQFKLKESSVHQRVLVERIKSIINTEETSNQGRIEIWRATLASMAQHPFLGVGVGNFPTILKQNPTAIKAGSSAHNLYLNFFAELGVFGFILLLLIIYELWRRGWRLLMRSHAENERFFGLNVLLYFTWIVWYSMTDVAIFDERAFLLFMILCGVLFSIAARIAPTRHAAA